MKQSPEKGHFLLGHSHRPPSSSHHGTVGSHIYSGPSMGTGDTGKSVP